MTMDKINTMEELISKQKALDLQMEAIQNEIEECTEKRNRLYDKRLEINIEQNENICEINALKSVSEYLHPDTMMTLFQDLNKIEIFHAAYMGEDERFTLEIKQVQPEGVLYALGIDGDFKKLKITIMTTSQKIIDIVRKCFTNTGCDCDAQPFPTSWSTYKCLYCENGSFGYNKDVAKSLLCPLCPDA
jgi:hypothetical protein